MLQFTASLCNASARLTPRPSAWRFAALLASSSTAPDPLSTPSKEEINSLGALDKTKEVPNESKGVENAMRGEKADATQTDLSARISSATNIEDLLQLSTVSSLSKMQALLLMSNITKRINSGDITHTEIMQDRRFQILQNKIFKYEESQKADLDTALKDIVITDKQLQSILEMKNITEIQNLSTPAMIKVITALSYQKKRHTPLLTILARGIIEYSEQLSIKQCSTLLYSLSALYFPHPQLLEKIRNDLVEGVRNSTQIIPKIGMLATSIGLLRYKDQELMDVICRWMLDHPLLISTLDMFGAVQTLAALNYKSKVSNELLERCVAKVTHVNLNRKEKWLDFVWSLVLLNQATSVHVSSVLDKPFIAALEATSSLNIPKKLKLLNINAAAENLIGGYNGPLFEKSSSVFDVELVKPKSKQQLLDAVVNTLQSIMPSSKYYDSAVETGMGFVIDARCCVNSLGHPVALDEANNIPDVKRIAIMVHDYHDYCLGKRDLIGPVQFYARLLTAKGYHVLHVSEDSFSTDDKLSKRSNFLETSIKAIATNTRT